MSALDNLIALMDRWDEWRRVRATPERLDDIERRVAELEDKLQRAPGEACPSCGALDFRVTESKPDPTFGEMGGIRRLMRCGACDFEESKLVTPK